MPFVVGGLSSVKRKLRWYAVKSDLTSKDTSLWSSGICTVLIPSINNYWMRLSMIS